MNEMSHMEDNPTVSSRTWLTNCWYVAAFASEIGEPLLARRLLDQPVVLFRLRNGKAVAMRDQCPHRLLPLSIGRRDGDDIQCGYHGLKFSGSDGRCTFIPGQPQIPSNCRATTYPLVERQGLAWIWLGAPGLADEQWIPDFPWMGDTHWRQSSGYHHFRCDYRLMTDNLLDLGHENYVHQRTIGNAKEQDIADFPLAVSIDDGVLRAHREMPRIEPPPFFQLFLNTQKLIDRWQTAIFMPPGINMTEAGAYVSGTPRAAAFINRIMHLLTPETERSSHYFWSGVRNYRLEDSNLTLSIASALSSTFDEDKTMLEIQQRVLDRDPSLRMPQFATKLDEAPLRARRMLERLCASEATQTNRVASCFPTCVGRKGNSSNASCSTLSALSTSTLAEMLDGPVEIDASVPGTAPDGNGTTLPRRCTRWGCWGVAALRRPHRRSRREGARTRQRNR